MKGILKSAYETGRARALEKLAGGPGSGVKGYNTATFDILPRSKYVSVGTRKALLDNMPYEEMMVPVRAITHISQDKIVPKKVQGLLRNPEVVKEKPIDVLVADDEVACIDGHHRLAVAQQMGLQSLPARVYVRRQENGGEGT